METMKEYLINNKMYRMDIFNKIRDKEDAYFIGYLMGDGGFMKPTHKRHARLFISSINEYIIEYFKNKYTPDSTINSRIPINKKRNIKTRNKSYKLIFSSKFSTLFNKYSLLQPKKKRKVINIPKKHYDAFLLGLFDSDGHITYGYRKDRNRLWSNFGLTHSSFDVLTNVQEFLHNELNISTTVRPRKDEKCYDLKISKNNSVFEIYKFLYKTYSGIHNTKKKNIYHMFYLSYQSQQQK